MGLMFSKGQLPSLHSPCERKLSHHVPDPFWLFSFPKRGLHPSSGVSYPGSPPHPGPVLLCFLARENPSNKQWSGTRGVSETLQKITKEEQFFQEVFPEALQWTQALMTAATRSLRVCTGATHVQEDLSPLFLYFLQCRMTSSELSTPKGLFPLYYRRCTSLPTQAALHHDSATVSSSSTAQQLLEDKKGWELEFHCPFMGTDHRLNRFQK